MMDNAAGGFQTKFPARVDGTTTIGIAIGVPEPWATQIKVARDRYGDPQADFIPTHVTLLPPTSIPFQKLLEIDAHLMDVANDMWPFRIQLRGAATFRPVSQVVFVPLVEGISGCERLEKSVRKGLGHRRRFPFHPHVTLVHDLPNAVLDEAFEDFSEFKAVFVADRFSVYQQSPEGEWELLKDYRLLG